MERQEKFGGNVPSVASIKNFGPEPTDREAVNRGDEASGGIRRPFGVKAVAWDLASVRCASLVAQGCQPVWRNPKIPSVAKVDPETRGDAAANQSTQPSNQFRRGEVNDGLAPLSRENASIAQQRAIVWKTPNVPSVAKVDPATAGYATANQSVEPSNQFRRVQINDAASRYENSAMAQERLRTLSKTPKVPSVAKLDPASAGHGAGNQLEPRFPRPFRDQAASGDFAASNRPPLSSVQSVSSSAVPQSPPLLDYDYYGLLDAMATPQAVFAKLASLEGIVTTVRADSGTIFAPRRGLLPFLAGDFNEYVLNGGKVALTDLLEPAQAVTFELEQQRNAGQFCSGKFKIAQVRKSCVEIPLRELKIERCVVKSIFQQHDLTILYVEHTPTEPVLLRLSEFADSIPTMIDKLLKVGAKVNVLLAPCKASDEVVLSRVVGGNQADGRCFRAARVVPDEVHSLADLEMQLQNEKNERIEAAMIASRPSVANSTG